MEAAGPKLLNIHTNWHYIKEKQHNLATSAPSQWLKFIFDGKVSELWS